jgi:hypothetical protein
MGELSPRIAEAVGSSRAAKVLLPINRCGIHVVSVREAPLATHIDNAVAVIKGIIGGEAPRPG